MPAHRKYFNLPESKTCPECGGAFSRPAGYGHDRWHKAVLCSLTCASAKGSRLRNETRAANFDRIFGESINRAAGQGPKGECWEWQATRDVKGYGRIGFRGKTLKAHRIALFGLADYDNLLKACHTCDNPSCVRPDHLFAGTDLDNTQDKMRKGRHRGNHRLTEDQARKVFEDPRIYREIAAEYGISTSNVGVIKQGLSWRNASSGGNTQQP